MLSLAFAFGAFFASIVLIPQWVQINLGYTATWAGYLTATMGFGSLMMKAQRRTDQATGQCHGARPRDRQTHAGLTRSARTTSSDPLASAAKPARRAATGRSCGPVAMSSTVGGQECGPPFLSRRAHAYGPRRFLSAAYLAPAREIPARAYRDPTGACWDEAQHCTALADAFAGKPCSYDVRGEHNLPAMRAIVISSLASVGYRDTGWATGSSGHETGG